VDGTVEMLDLILVSPWFQLADLWGHNVSLKMQPTVGSRLKIFVFSYWKHCDFPDNVDKTLVSLSLVVSLCSVFVWSSAEHVPDQSLSDFRGTIGYTALNQSNCHLPYTNTFKKTTITEFLSQEDKRKKTYCVSLVF